MFIAFFGIFVYGLLAALPGSVLPTLERNQYLPNDSSVGTFLLVNAVGAVFAYLVSGPIIDRLGKKFALLLGTAVVIGSMAGFALTVTNVPAGAALFLILACSLALGMGANAIVASGHALVVDVAPAWRNAALNLLDICFGLGLAALPLVVQRLQQRGGLGLIFTTLAGVSVILFVLVLAPRFPVRVPAVSSPIQGAAGLVRNPSFWLLALGLFMYIGAEVSVGKWVVTFIQRDERILASQGVNATQLQELARVSPESLSKFFETDPLGIAVAGYALGTLTFFALALLVGRLVSSFLLAVLRVNSFLLITVGSAITTVSLILALTAGTASTVRLGLIVAGFGMGPIFPTSVGLASVMMPRMAGTAMSLVMGIGFAGLLVIPPAVGYVSSWVGGEAGNLRAGLLAIMAASVLMLALHILLTLREGRRALIPEDALERDAVAETK
jgi:MFS transporter, DHA1 family, purine base/nucleoside efflux pump